MEHNMETIGSKIGTYYGYYGILRNITESAITEYYGILRILQNFIMDITASFPHFQKDF